MPEGADETHIETSPEQSPYFRSKLAKLNHFSGNALGVVCLYIRINKPIDREGAKQRFLNGLKSAKTAPDYGGITEQVLDEIIQRAAATDWNDDDAVQVLAEWIGRFNGE
jgi:hypothetical protein